MSSALKAFPYRAFGLAVLIGAAGGAAFSWWNLPLAWMLGAMTFSLVAVQFKLPLTAPSSVRPPMSAIIGVMLGASFTPEILGALPSWTGVILGGLLFLIVASALGALFYSKVAGYDSRTAFFCGMPGGLIEMLMLADHYRADTRRIALAHSGRVFFTIMTLPFLIEFLSGTKIATSPGTGVTIADMTGVDMLWLLGTAVGGAVLGKIARLPACYLLGPMLLSMVVHGAGLTSFTPPSELIIVAQIIIGTIVGCRFAGTTTREVGKVFVLSSVFAVFVVMVAMLFAYSVSLMTGHPPIPLLLAYSPAGVAEMGLIALTLGVDVMLVTALHLLRIFVSSIGAGVIASLLWSSRDSEN